jgi:hypothetical protein
MKPTGIKVIEVSADFVKAHSCREYNPKEWDNTVNRFNKYKDVKWYYAEPQGGYAYERFYCEYTIEEGLRIFNKVSYSSCLSGGGFIRIVIINGEIYRNGFGVEGNDSIVNTKEGRKWLRDNICKYGIAVANGI